MATGYRGKALKRRREAIGASQTVVARLLGIHQTAYSMIETEHLRMPRGYSVLIAAALGRLEEEARNGVPI